MPLWKRVLSFIAKGWTAAVVIGSSLPTGMGAATREENVLRSRTEDDFARFNNQTQCLAMLSENIPMNSGDNLVSPAIISPPSFSPSITLYGDCTLSGEGPFVPKLWSKECRTAPAKKAGKETVEDYYKKPELFALTADDLIHDFTVVQNRVRPIFDRLGASWHQLSFNSLSITVQKKLMENVLKEEHFSLQGEQHSYPGWTFKATKSNYNEAFAKLRGMIAEEEMLSPQIINSLMQKIMNHSSYRVDPIGGSDSAAYFAPASAVEYGVQGLCNYLKNEDLFNPHRDRLLVLTQALFVQTYILALHPYSDGNGRLGLLLANFILMAADMPPIPPRFEFVQGQDMLRFTTFPPGYPEHTKKLIEYGQTPRVAFHLSPFMSLQMSQKQDAVINKRDTAKHEEFLKKQKEPQMILIQRYMERILTYYRTEAMAAVDEEHTISRRMP